MGSRISPDATDFCRTALLFSLSAGLALLAPGAARADTTASPYTSEPVVMSGDRAGNVLLPSRSHLFVGGLTDAGQLVVSTGAVDQSQPELLIQYAGGQFTTIVAPPSALISPWAGDVAWPHNIALARPLSVNAQGNVVFTAATTYGGSILGTYRWDAATGHTLPVVLKGMPASGNLTFTQPGGYAPAINNSNEIALIGRVKDPDGKNGYGLFRLGRDGRTESVAIPHQAVQRDGALAGKISIDQFAMPSINDAGAVAFLAHPDGSAQQNAYLWDQGNVTPILTIGAPGPGGSKITAIRGVFLNSRNHNVLVVAATDRKGNSRFGLYRVQYGKAAAVAAPGDGMPDYKRLQTIQFESRGSEDRHAPSVAVSAANSLGQHAFLATLEDGSEAAYRTNTDGTLSLILNGGEPAKPVQIMSAARRLTFVAGSRPSINSHGQVAFSAQYDGGPDIVVLLTPAKR